MSELSSESSSAGKGRHRYRILFVTSDKFPPFRPAAKALFADGLAAEGHRIDWLVQAADGEPYSGPQRYRSGVAFVAPTHDGASRLARLKKHWQDFRNDLRVFTFLRRNRYSVVQVKDKYLGALIALAAARLHGVPVVYWLAYPHGEAALYAASTGVARYRWLYMLRGALQKWLLYRVILPACTHSFVQSEQMRADIEQEGIPAEKMTPVPSSVKLDELDATKADIGLPPHTIVYLGTLIRERRLDFLLRVHKLVRKRVPDARMLFVGKGETPEDEELLRREAERLEIQRSVRFTGLVPMQRAWEYVRASAACVSPYYPVPTLLSTSPTKLIEYMALRKAVVVNDHPEQSEIIRRSRAGYVRSWDEAEFADALVDLLENPAKAEAMGANGRRFVERHRTHAAMVAVVRGCYDRVLSEAATDRDPEGAPASGSGRD